MFTCFNNSNWKPRFWPSALDDYVVAYVFLPLVFLLCFRLYWKCQALQYRPTGRRNLGWPRKRWKDQLHKGTCYTHKPAWTWWREGKWVWTHRKMQRSEDEWSGSHNISEKLANIKGTESNLKWWERNEGKWSKWSEVKSYETISKIHSSLGVVSPHCTSWLTGKW